MVRSVIFSSVLIAICGCVGLPHWTMLGEAPPTGAVHQVHATWEPYIAVAPDPINNGAPLTGLAGRVYLFGPNLGYPLEGAGKIDVALWDMSKGTEEYMHGWRFDRDTLRKLLRKDAVGWGYTLFLPTEKLNDNVKRVKIKLCYGPDAGSPLYAPEATLTILRDGRPTVQQTVAGGATKK